MKIKIGGNPIGIIRPRFQICFLTVGFDSALCLIVLCRSLGQQHNADCGMEPPFSGFNAEPGSRGRNRARFTSPPRLPTRLLCPFFP